MASAAAVPSSRLAAWRHAIYARCRWPTPYAYLGLGDLVVLLCFGLLADTRQALALQHVRDPLCSISAIAYLLGFADTSGFNRAFTRWTGQAPSQYREGLLKNG